jgi:hypothetical protein
MLLSASGMVPFHFLSQKDCGHALGCRFLWRHCGLSALDQRQARFLVPGDHRRLGIRLGVTCGEPFAQQVSHRVFELPPFAHGPEFHLLDQGIGQIEGCFHAPIFLVSQLSVNTLFALAYARLLGLVVWSRLLGATAVPVQFRDVFKKRLAKIHLMGVPLTRRESAFAATVVLLVRIEYN